MTIKIITGTILGNDRFGGLQALKRKGFFYQWYFTKHGWGKKKAKVFSEISSMGNLVNIINTTGSGKTLLGAIYLYKAHKAGWKTAANMPINFIDKVIYTYEDFLSLEGYEIMLDDIKHIIPTWKSKGAEISTELSNASRKKKDLVDITTQRLENYVPPDIRNVADELHVPYIRCFDATRKSPDWTPTNPRYYPLELCDLRFTAGGMFLDYKRYDLTGKTGQIIIHSFDTMNISHGLTD